MNPNSNDGMNSVYRSLFSFYIPVLFCNLLIMYSKGNFCCGIAFNSLYTYVYMPFSGIFNNQLNAAEVLQSNLI